MVTFFSFTHDHWKLPLILVTYYHGAIVAHVSGLYSSDSSEYSDWCVDTSSNLQPPKRKSTRIRKRKRYTSTENTEEEDEHSTPRGSREGTPGSPENSQKRGKAPKKQDKQPAKKVKSKRGRVCILTWPIINMTDYVAMDEMAVPLSCLAIKGQRLIICYCWIHVTCTRKYKTCQYKVKQAGSDLQQSEVDAIFCIHSIWLKPIGMFWNNVTQMFTILCRRVARKALVCFCMVKVILAHQRLEIAAIFSVSSIPFKLIGMFETSQRGHTMFYKQFLC